jgi:hypothetical protein
MKQVAVEESVVASERYQNSLTHTLFGRSLGSLAARKTSLAQGKLQQHLPNKAYSGPCVSAVGLPQLVR